MSVDDANDLRHLEFSVSNNLHAVVKPASDLNKEEYAMTVHSWLLMSGKPGKPLKTRIRHDVSLRYYASFAF
jgi:hypothetical protein